MAPAALLTRISIGPPSPSTASGTIRWRSASSARLATMVVTVAPCFSRRAAVSCSDPARVLCFSSVRAVIATSAPSAASRSATAAPMPRLAPVTSARLPAKRVIDLARPLRLLDSSYEDLVEGLGHVARRHAAACLQPEVRVVVHAEPGPGRQPRVDVAELARLHAGLEDGLDLSFVLAPPTPELVGALAAESVELVEDDPDVIGLAVDHVEQLLAEHGELG